MFVRLLLKILFSLFFISHGNLLSQQQVFRFLVDGNIPAMKNLTDSLKQAGASRAEVAGMYHHVGGMYIMQDEDSALFYLRMAKDILEDLSDSEKTFESEIHRAFIYGKLIDISPLQYFYLGLRIRDIKLTLNRPDHHYWRMLNAVTQLFEPSVVGGDKATAVPILLELKQWYSDRPEQLDWIRHDHLGWLAIAYAYNEKFSRAYLIADSIPDTQISKGFRDYVKRTIAEEE